MINILNKIINIINDSFLDKSIKININLIVLNIIYYSLSENINNLVIYKIEKELEKMIIILDEINDPDEIFELKLYFYINKKNTNIVNMFIKTIKLYEINNNKIYLLIHIKNIKRIILKNKLWCNKLGTAILL